MLFEVGFLSCLYRFLYKKKHIIKILYIFVAKYLVHLCVGVRYKEFNF